MQVVYAFKPESFVWPNISDENGEIDFIVNRSEKLLLFSELLLL